MAAPNEKSSSNGGEKDVIVIENSQNNNNIEVPKSAPADKSTSAQGMDGDGDGFIFQYQDLNAFGNDGTTGIHSSDMNEGHSILEKCIQQYEIFFEVYLGHRVLQLPYFDHQKQEEGEVEEECKEETMAKDIEKPLCMPKCLARIKGIDQLFDTLKIRVENRTQNLQHLLNRSMMSTDTKNGGIGDSIQLEGGRETFESLNPVTDSVSSTRTDLQSLLNLRLTDDQRLAIKLAINLLVEMSTFPHCTKNIALDRNGKIFN